MAKHSDFISQNVAPPSTRRIGVYNERGNRVGYIPLGSLAFPDDAGVRRYSFGALSDVHIVYDTAQDDFRRALVYLNNDVDVEFICITGDLTDIGSDTELAQYKSMVDEYSPDTPVYAISGNHEASERVVTSEVIQPYTGQPLYYSFAHDGDVFIMCGLHRWNNEHLFADGELQWIYETLETNRDKRCFVFFHVFPWGDCGNPGNLYTANIFSGTQGTVFQSLLRHYKNTVLFHGHSHMKFKLQEIDDRANFSSAEGYKSIHIPSIAVPRDANASGSAYKDVYADSEGYVVDVYRDGIHLKGRDFITGEYLPIASYWIDTKLQTVAAGTYTDSTGTIVT